MTEPTTDTRAEGVAIAFGIAAAVAVLFNMLLTWAKESIEPLEEFMVSLTGHHWWTHGIADIVVFVVVGLALMGRSSGKRMTERDVYNLAGAVVIGGLGLAAWFLVI